MLSYRDEMILNCLTFQPKRSSELQKITGYSDVEVREAIRNLRLNGVAVCSGGKGFWLWNGKDDSWRHTKNNIKSRAKKLIELYNAMEDRPITGQVEL